MPGPIITIVDAAPEDYKTVAEILREGGYLVAPPESPAAAAAAAPTATPDLILLNMQTDFGLRRFRELKSRPTLEPVPIIGILEKYDADFAARCLE